MKYKKYSYILVLILMLLVGINGVNAAEDPQKKNCYYMSNSGDFKIRATLEWNEGNWDYAGGILKTLSDYTNVVIDRIGDEDKLKNTEGIINWWKTVNFWKRKECIDGKNVCFGFVYNSQEDARFPSEAPSCPDYLVMEDNGQIAVWATNSSTLAQQAQTESRKNGYIAYYGKEVDADTYFKEYIDEGIIEFEEGTPTCTEDYEAIFGRKDDPESIRYMVNEVLNYVRIIVPILIILFGVLDFAKAVIAGREDGMRKAQWDFVKRLLIGVAVFFVPTLVDIVMSLADIVWAGEYIHCPL